MHAEDLKVLWCSPLWMSPGGLRRFRVQRLLLAPHLLRSVLRLVRLPAQHGGLRRGRSLARVRVEDGVHTSQVSGRPAAPGRHLLDVRLDADHRAGNAGGSQAGMEVDDPDLRGPERHPPLPLQVHSRVGSLQRVCWERRGRHGDSQVDRRDEQSVSAARTLGGDARERERQLEGSAQLHLPEDVLASLVLVVCGVLCVLRLGPEQFGASGEEFVVCDGRRPRASGQTPPRGQPVLLCPLRVQRLPDAPHQLPGRGFTHPSQHLPTEHIRSAAEFDGVAAGVGLLLPDAEYLHEHVRLHAPFVPAARSGLHELHCGLHLHGRGLSDCIAFARDGLLYVGQSHRRNDRSLHCTGAHVSVCDSGTESLQHRVRALRCGELPVAHRNKRSSAASTRLMIPSGKISIGHFDEEGGPVVQFTGSIRHIRYGDALPYIPATVMLKVGSTIRHVCGRNPSQPGCCHDDDDDNLKLI
ncbi:putative transporter SVOPL isoform X4 [Phyllopteryx taeniolatus]|uniref:putative transporter SVOPL isoform X4 n=1 Tax=Phyllopteryx taeniolatus TaxID=161469 RepID=UPI002AD53654|nr:putative transporter SVOPL isoform X4 [Phyllopteryx taeniolatus]